MIHISTSQKVSFIRFKVESSQKAEALENHLGQVTNALQDNAMIEEPPKIQVVKVMAVETRREEEERCKKLSRRKCISKSEREQTNIIAQLQGASKYFEVLSVFHAMMKKLIKPKMRSSTNELESERHWLYRLGSQSSEDNGKILFKFIFSLHVSMCVRYHLNMKAEGFL